MRALKAAVSTMSLSGWFSAKPLPEPEAFCGKPRPMTGFLATLTDEQKKLAREYTGEETHGDQSFAR
ncbi:MULTISPECIES: hypothetical protein [unclassified Mesorhizobium]|uniref:hypothetical protein n=1 Tax=unclassified Mesorhizobium TaxID=325217 RepID=UPI00042A34A0|nr:hypothetical protein [Mesorhizobium sp. L103C105A0]